MVTSDTSCRENDESYRAMLKSEFDRNTTTKRKSRGNMFDRRHATFRQEKIQPTTTRKNTVPPTSNIYRRRGRGHGGIDLSIKGPKKRCFPRLVSEFVQQEMVQPPNTTYVKDDTSDEDCSEMKKKQHSSDSRTETTINRESKLELRIEGDTMNDIIDDIRTKTFSTSAQEGSSVFFKGIRRSSSSISDFERGDDETDESVLLLHSLKALVKNKGSSWKRIRIQECEPWIAEVLLSSPYCNNIEEIHIVGVCDGEQYQPNHNQSISAQTDQSSESSIATKDTHTSSLVISLLRKTTRIKELVLKNCNLDSCELIRIMKSLCAHPNHPKSLEHLDLRFNKFTPVAIQSILAFHLRSSLHSLKTLKLRQGLRCAVHRNTRHAILQSLRCNRVILESIDIFDWDKSVQCLLDINRAKRRFILCNNDRFPRTIWPLLLEQALVANEEDDCDVQGNTSSTRRQANVVYHIFRNGGPMLLQQHHPNMD